MATSELHKPMDSGYCVRRRRSQFQGVQRQHKLVEAIASCTYVYVGSCTIYTGPHNESLPQLAANAEREVPPI